MSDADATAALDSLDVTKELPVVQDATGEQLPDEFLEKLKANKRKRRLRVGIAAAAAAAAVVALVLAFVFVGASGQDEQATMGTYTQQVQQGTLDLTVEGSGTLEANSTTSVSAEVGGTVKKVYVSEGDSVKKGDTLFTLESDEVQSAVSEKREAMDDAYAAYVQAKAAAKKSSASSSGSSASGSSASGKSSSSGGSSASSGVAGSQGASTQAAPKTASYSSADSSASATLAASGGSDSSASQAYSAYKQAKSAYEDAVDDLDKLTVKASSSGTVTSVSITKGDTVSAGGSSSSGSSSAAMVISDMDKMALTVQVSEYDIDNIEKGQAATVAVKALDATVQAKVKAVSKTASSSGDSSGAGSSSSSTAYYDVTLSIPKPVDGMLAGMNATAEIVYRSFSDALLVPTAAVSTDPQGNASVTVGGSDETGRQVSVSVLGGNDELTAAEGELSTDMSVVVTYQIDSSEDSTSSGGRGFSAAGGMGGMMGGSGMGGGSGARGGSGDGGGPGGGTPPSGGPGGGN